MTETDPLSEAGVALVKYRVNGGLRWLFRVQHESDQGVDAQIETANDGRGTGQLICAQIKTGPSYFNETTDEGWTFRFGANHHRLWINHSLPVVVVLVDLDTESVYWQRIHDTTVDEAGQNYKVLVPRANRVEDAGPTWEQLAGDNARHAADKFQFNRTVLPPTTLHVLEEHFTPRTPEVEVLAMHLAEGRGNPAGTVQAILTSRPYWVQASPHLWAAVGSYASEHECHDESSRAFEASAELFLDQNEPNLPAAAGSFAAAAINSRIDDLDRARQLLDRALVLDAAPVHTAIASLVVAADSPGDPVEVPDNLLADNDDNLTKHELLQNLIANGHMRRREYNAAVRRLDMALQAAPQSSQSMDRLANILGSRDHTPHRQPDDLPRAVDLLVEAIRQRRQWAGPTTELLLELARPLALQGRTGEIVYWLAAPPHGSASPEEAGHPGVIREAVRAAWILRDLDLVAELATSLGDTDADRLLLHMTDVAALSDTELIEAHRREAERARDASDIQELTSEVHALALLGVDETSLLAEWEERGDLEPWTGKMCAAVAKIRSGNIDDGVVDLRIVAGSAPTAAEMLISILLEHRDLEGAISAADTAYHRHRNPLFVIKKADLLVKARRYEEAEQAVSTALASTSQFPQQRQDLASFLVWRARKRGSWVDAEAIAANTIAATTPPHPEAIWMLVEIQIGSGRSDRARETLDRYRPDITDVRHAQLWCDAHRTAPWTDELVATALGFVEQFGNEPGFCGAVLSHIMMMTTSVEDLRPNPDDSEAPLAPGVADGPYQLPVIESDLRRRTYEALEQLTAKHGEATGIRVFEDSDEELAVERIVEMARERASNQWHELPELLARGRIQTGMLATYLHMGYATTLVRQVAGFYLAGSASEGEHATEVAVARSALGNDAVVDTSALVVSNFLTDGAALRSRFRTLLMPTALRRDLNHAEFELRANGASAGSFGWDPEANRPVYWDNPPERHRQASDRLRKLIDAASDVIQRDTNDEAARKLNERLGEIPDSMRKTGWIAAIELAIVEDLPLWCDDLAARRLGIALGAKTFGTPALVDAIVEDLVTAGRLDEALEMASRSSDEFIANGVIDVPATIDQLEAQAKADHWHPLTAALVLTRPAWWSDNDDALSKTITLLRMSAAERPDAGPTWQFAAMLGAARTYGPPEYAAKCLAIMALIGFKVDMTKEDLLVSVRNAREAAKQSRKGDPLEMLQLVRPSMDGLPHERTTELVAELIEIVEAEKPTERLPIEESDEDWDEVVQDDSDDRGAASG